MSRDQDSALESVKATANFVTWLCRVFSCTVEVFLHWDFGIRYLGISSLLAVPLILLFRVAGQHHNPVPILVFLWAYIALGIAGQTHARIREWFGRRIIHSRYSGHPHLCRLLPRWSERTIKQLEPLLVVAIGWGVKFLNLPLGLYLMCAGAAMAMSVAMSLAISRQRARDINDAIIEQSHIAEESRQIRGE